MKVTVETKFHKGDCVSILKRKDLGCFIIKSVLVLPTEENSGKVTYVLQQMLFKSGSFGLPTYFTIKGIKEEDLELEEVAETSLEEFEDSINLENLF